MFNSGLIQNPIILLGLLSIHHVQTQSTGSLDCSKSSFLLSFPTNNSPSSPSSSQVDSSQAMIAEYKNDLLKKASVQREWKFGDFHGMSLAFASTEDCQSFVNGTERLRTNFAKVSALKSLNLMNNNVNGSNTHLYRRRTGISFYHDGFHVEHDEHVQIMDVQMSPPWGLDRIDQAYLPLDRMYRYASSSGRNVDIYIVDTGIRTDHPEFEGRVEWGMTVKANEPNEDNHGHGTHVAGVAAGKTFGVSKRANLIAVKALGGDGKGSFSDVLDGLDYVYRRVTANRRENYSVVNLSIQGRTNQVFNRAITALGRLGIHITAASGNEGIDSCQVSPASSTPSSFVISVGAVDSNDRVAKFSNYGDCTSVLAPGVRILSADAEMNGSPSNDDNVYDDNESSSQEISEIRGKVMSGTSMASPFVAGMLANWISSGNFEDVSPSAMKDFLINNVTLNNRNAYSAVSNSRVNYAGIIYNPF